MVEYKIGDPVWAQMKGYPPWPAKIISPPPDAKVQKNKHYVFFFGSNNSAWIPDERIIPHSEQRLQNAFSKEKKTAAFQIGIDALSIYSQSYKRSSPLKMKREKNKDEVVKIVSCDSKKHERKLSSNKMLFKKGTKRSLNDSSTSNTYPPSKSQKFENNNPVPNHIPDDSDRSSRHVRHSKLQFGFIGFGALGKTILHTLMQSGHDVTVWNRSVQDCDPIVFKGVKRAHSPIDLILECDITFCCMPDPDSLESILYDQRGILNGLLEASKLGKGRRGVVNMTHSDPGTSVGIGQAIIMKGGVYLEALVCDRILNTTNRTKVLAAGDSILFSQCENVFQAIGNKTFYLGCDVGSANTLYTILTMLSGNLCVALAEALVLAEKSGLEKKDFVESIADESIYTPFFDEKVKMMANLSFGKVTPLKHVRKELDLGLEIANTSCLPTPISAATNEILKYAMMRGNPEEDVSAVYKVVKFNKGVNI